MYRSIYTILMAFVPSVGVIKALFRLSMASTMPQAHQLVNHRHILVNGSIVDVASYRCKPRDIITAKDEKKSRALI